MERCREWERAVFTKDLNHFLLYLLFIYPAVHNIQLLSVLLWNKVWTAAKHQQLHVSFNVLVLSVCEVDCCTCVCVCDDDGGDSGGLVDMVTSVGQSRNRARIRRESGRDGCYHAKLMCFLSPHLVLSLIWCVHTPKHPPAFQCLWKCCCCFTLCQLQGTYDSMLCSTCYWHMWCLIFKKHTNSGLLCLFSLQHTAVIIYYPLVCS